MSGIIDCEIHIGDEVFVHGYIDEIRNDTIIIRNVGGYFGTSRDEVFYYEEDGTMIVAEQTEPHTERIKTLDYCDICKHKGCDNCIANNLDDYCVPSGYEPTTQTETQNSNLTFEKRNCSEIPSNCDTCRFELYCPEMCEGCCEWDSHYEPKDEPQTDCSWK